MVSCFIILQTELDYLDQADRGFTKLASSIDIAHLLSLLPQSSVPRPPGPFSAAMPKIRTNRTKPPPEGYEDIADILEDYAKKMRDAENDTSDGKRKAEGVW